MNIYDYEYKQEEHFVHERRSCWGTTYPSYEEYHVPPPTTTMHKMVSYPSYHYEPSDDDDDDDHDHGHGHGHDHMAVKDSRWTHHDDDRSRGWDNGTRHANNNDHAEIKKNKYHGGILRQYRQYGVIGQGGQEVKNKNGRRCGETAPRVNHNHNHHYNNNNNHNDVMEDYPRKYPINYGEVSRLKDDYDHGGIGGEELESLIKRMHGAGMVKKIEVIEYESKIYRGAHQELRVVNGNGDPTNYNTPFMPKTYPNYKAPWVKGF